MIEAAAAHGQTRVTIVTPTIMATGAIMVAIVVMFVLAVPVVVLPSAQPGTTKIETQHWHAEGVQRFHRVEDNLVVERASIKRMRVTNHASVRRGRDTLVEQRFERSGGAFEKE